jgi:hypothetical protein
MRNTIVCAIDILYALGGNKDVNKIGRYDNTDNIV